MPSFLLRHFEKGVLAAFLGFFVFVAAKALFAKPVELEQQVALVELDQKLDAHLATYAASVPPVTDETAKLHEVLDAPAPVGTLGHWLAHKRPNLACAPAPKTILPSSTHAAPSFTAVAEHGQVVLDWGANLANDCVVTSLSITRFDETGRETSLALPKEGTHLVDTGVGERASYTYRLTELAEAPPGHEALAANEVSFTVEKMVTLPRDLIIRVDREAVVDADGQPVSVKLTVHRWKAGSWGRGKELFTVRPKEKIGWKEGRDEFSSGIEVTEILLAPKEVRVKIRWPSGKVETLSSKDTYAELAAPRR